MHSRVDLALMRWDMEWKYVGFEHINSKIFNFSGGHNNCLFLGIEKTPNLMLSDQNIYILYNNTITMLEVQFQVALP